MKRFDCTNPYHLVTRSDVRKVFGSKPQQVVKDNPLGVSWRSAVWEVQSLERLCVKLEMNEDWPATVRRAKRMPGFCTLPDVSQNAYSAEQGCLLEALLADGVVLRVRIGDRRGVDLTPLLRRGVDRFHSVSRRRPFKPRDLVYLPDVEAVFCDRFGRQRQKTVIRDVAWEQYYKAEKSGLSVCIRTGTEHMWSSACRLTKVAKHEIAEVAGIGDEAFFNHTRGQLNVRVGDTMLRVQVRGLPEGAEDLPRELAWLAAARIAGYAPRKVSK